MGYALGLDFGTSGARGMAIEAAADATPVATVRASLSEQTPQAWRTALETLLGALPAFVRADLEAIAIDGTSATVLLCDASGTPLGEPLLYDDARGEAVGDRVRQLAPPRHPACSGTSSFSKLIWLRQQGVSPRVQFLHQADWLGFLLHGRLGTSDYHNALKLGYDPGALAYPDWIPQDAPRLPQVVAPGTTVGRVLPTVARRLQLSPRCQVKAGTTDSIAAFLASGAREPGEAVTSLGSTLVLKLLSRTRVDDGRYGVYSHRLGDLWLTGGASNTGGAVLRSFFDEATLVRLSDRVPVAPSPLEYYPLLRPGERFPTSDPTFAPRLSPRPADEVAFLHGLLDGMARIEAQGYETLAALGATPLRRVMTAGGGARNEAWTGLRALRLGVPVSASAQTEAAFGTAQLAVGRF